MSESKAMYSIPVARQIKFGSACLSLIELELKKKTQQQTIRCNQIFIAFTIVY